MLLDGWLETESHYHPIIAVTAGEAQSYFSFNTCAHMVFHAEGLVGIELRYAAKLAVQPVRGFENAGHYFSAAKSVLPAVDEPPADVSSSSRYHYVHIASLIVSASL